MKSATLTTAAAMLALAGCFNEPTPAYKTVPEGARVYLSDRGLKDLSQHADALKLGDAIDYLNLDRNDLSEFPPEIASLTGLKWLRLNDNRLSDVPDISRLTKLRRIYLRGNRLAFVPASLKALPALTDIDLSLNPITEVPQWLAEKEGLENISLSGTKIEKLPDNIDAWRSLTSLQLGDLRLSAKEMARIRAALPKTAVVF